jgi:hypothetical protein
MPLQTLKRGQEPLATKQWNLYSNQALFPFNSESYFYPDLFNFSMSIKSNSKLFYRPSLLL